MTFDEHVEHNFKGTAHLIVYPIHRIMLIQSKLMTTKRSESMKEFRIVSILAHVFTDVPERLIHVNHLSKNLMHYVLMMAWPLTRIDVMHQIPDITEPYEAMSDAYYDDDWEKMGIECAKIAHIIHEDQKKVMSEEYVKSMDEFEKGYDHQYFDTIQD